MATVTKHEADVARQQECFAFTLLLCGFDEITEEIADAFFEAGCDDALLGVHCGNPYLAFNREAGSMEEAIKSAIKAVESVAARGIAVEVIRVMPRDEDTISTFNAFLKVRRQLLAGLPPEFHEKMESLIATMLEHNPQRLKELLESLK